MGKLKKLAGDTIIYGASTIVGRLLNWLLMPFYIRTLDPVQFGGVVNIYSYIAVVLVILTFGFETGYFRFAKKTNRQDLLSTLGGFVTMLSLFFVLLVYFLKDSIASLLGNEHLTSEYFFIGALIVSLDAITSIPFADLRIRNKTMRYATLKFVSVLLNIVFNVFFLVICPYLYKEGYTPVNYIYDPNNKLLYVFIANLLSSLIISVFLIPQLFKGHFVVRKELLRAVLRYSYPVMIVGLFGMLIQNIDKILMPHLIGENAMEALAIYGANYKIGVLMALFIQSYRLAFEPFFFKEGKEKASTELYARILKYFVIFGMIVFVGVLVFIDLINVLLLPEYYEGNRIIPLILLGQLFFGIYYSLSLWYKLTDKTHFGAIISGIGAVLAIVANLIFVPSMGYMGAALSSLLCFLLMTIISYFLGQKYYPVNYPVANIIFHIVSGMAVVVISQLYTSDNQLFHFGFKGTIFVAYFVFLYFTERKEFNKILS
ncbi:MULTISPECIES: lipopolysaccharide biosynthesis protein [unclassified Carboxylicivirga]|uniref:lipopolysaccharide biosynthesis protein n=1 Tax=Carboxylicivirga TaxID=1628153 RepID=UPI003D34080C